MLLTSNPLAHKPVFSTRRASELVGSLLGKQASQPETLEASMLGHLKAIEAIETKIAAGGLSSAELISLVALGHETINEIHRLHLCAELRRIYVAQARPATGGMVSP